MKLEPFLVKSGILWTSVYNVYGSQNEFVKRVTRVFILHMRSLGQKSASTTYIVFAVARIGLLFISMLQCERQGKKIYPSFVCSGSACNLSEGLERLGLADIRLVVRLMCLAAAGRADFTYMSSSYPDTSFSQTQYYPGPSTSMNSGPTLDMTSQSSPTSSLSYLSSAIGALVLSNPSAAKLLVQLCTKV